MPVNKVQIVLDRARKTFNQGERITGTIVIENKYELGYESILVAIYGFVDINFNLKSISFVDTLHGSKMALILVDRAQELAKDGRLLPGRTEIPFQFVIEPNDPRAVLYETYHGVFLSVQYQVRCFIKRPIFRRDLEEATEFIIEHDPDPIGAPPLEKKPLEFRINPQNVNSTRQDVIPNFEISGRLDSGTWQLSEPVTGELVIEECDTTIRSVELQLVRVETCGITPGDRDYSRDATEVQNIQIGEGNLLRGVPISIYMLLPRLFTCPTLIRSDFRVEFELNLVIIFDDNHLVSETLPIKTIRSTMQAIDLS